MKNSYRRRGMEFQKAQLEYSAMLCDARLLENGLNENELSRRYWYRLSLGHEGHGNINSAYIEGKSSMRWFVPYLPFRGLAGDHCTSKWGCHRLNLTS